MKKMLYLVLLLLLCRTITLEAQVIIGADRDPDIDAILELVSNDKLGLLLPRVKLTDVLDPSPLSKHEVGMVVYNLGDYKPYNNEEEEEEEDNNSTVYLPQGYYYNTGIEWVQIADSNIASWRSIATKEAATSNTEDIYQIGAVVIGASEIEPHTQFSVVSTDKGVLMPRMTTAQRDAIGGDEAIPDGLLIYNTTTKCFNYYNSISYSGGGWLSLCGNLDPADFELLDCNAIVNGTYKVGVALNSDNVYALNLRVNKAGTYTILLNTGNGYSFSKSGVFSEAGIFTITLEGQGVPLNAADPGDTPIIQFNGETITPQCTLPIIPVQDSEVRYSITNCGSLAATGTYKKGTIVNASENYVDLEINVTSTGTTIFEATPMIPNGLTFRSDSYTFSNIGDHTVRLNASGAPINVGTYNFIIDEKVSSGTSQSCNFSVDISTDIGTFTNPAQSCLEIYNQGIRTDGEYWIQQRNGSRIGVKTLCDMTNGGYTLIYSFSEKTAYDGGSIYAPANSIHMSSIQHQLRTNYPRNVITTEDGTINYNDFRLSLSSMQNVRAEGKYRVQIAYTPTKNMNDYWAQNMHLYITPPSGYDFINNSYSLRNTTHFIVDGMIFGKSFASSAGSVLFDGSSASGTHNWWNSTYYGTHLDFGYDFRLSGTSQHRFTTNLKDEAGTDYSYTFSTRGFNNTFGWFSELSGDHQFGKCGSNDYIINTTAASDPYFRCSYSQLQPHSFNNGEGRYLQWWVK